MPTADNVVTIIPAHVGSNRLPGKVLRSILGRPLLERLVQRLRCARHVGPIVVATTHYAQDDPIARLCWQLNLPCYRGDPDDVLDRTYRAALKYDAAAVAIVPSNCPLVDPAVVDRAIAAYRARPSDYVSNLHPPTYPDGNDVEVMSIAALESSWRNAWRAYQREQITPYIWENPHRFRLHNVAGPCGPDHVRAYRWAVDYPQDLLLVQAIFGALCPQKPHFTLPDILALLQREPRLAAVNAAYAGAAWRRHHTGQPQPALIAGQPLPELVNAAY